ncbi:hypothetical protein RJ639_032978 [Escallonia herrerae]|uniref:Retrovirus-related Pol polyprotein from transposon TNT 1-94 n=1 Tax=Escallonia herrerae TaxID=1293975 RepID=A0AA88WX24_9ASTE|nr:hypothetical protein RJ639_032978 [Escallonia herrerae]
MNLWGIQNGGTITAIRERETPKGPPVLQWLKQKIEDDVIGQHSALVAATGNGGKALNMSTLVTNSAWIIDSGATDHMTFDSRQVSTLKLSSQKFVTTANGTPAPIVGEGHLPLTDNMNLDSVLVVPSLDYNLLSVSQITTALFCVVIFWPNFCVFKDIRTRQTIGCGVRRGKLYYLDLVSKSSDKLRQALMALVEAIVAPVLPNLPPHVFGCVAFVHLHKHQRNKLSPRALRCVFVGYAAHQKGYRCYHPPTHKMFITLDVAFHEDLMYFSTESELQGEHQKEIQTLDYDDELTENVDVHISEDTQISEDAESNQSFVNQLSTVSIPHNVHEALADPRWKKAMNEKMKSLQENKTWEVIDRPPGKKLVRCRWIYTVKYKADGTIERFKLRLVAKGYTQTYGIDYTKTFALVAKINTVRVLLSLVANLNWPLQQFDVKNAFLHGELSEEVYMELPPGCMMPKTDSQKVCKLQKALYGLKQSLRAWFGRFTKSMRAFGYHQSNSDHTLFLKKNQGKITALIVYVDDMVVTGNDPEEREALQGHLSREFKMKDLRPLKYFLGIEVSRSNKGIFLSQRKYALNLLRETGMLACQPVDTLVEEGLKLRIESN